MKNRINQIIDHLAATGIDRRFAYIPAAPHEGGFIPQDGDEVFAPESIYTFPARVDADGTRHPIVGVYRITDIGPLVDCLARGGAQYAVGPTSCLVLASHMPTDFMQRANDLARRM
jgi:hypothetical protein